MNSIFHDPKMKNISQDSYMENISHNLSNDQVGYEIYFLLCTTK